MTQTRVRPNAVDPMTPRPFRVVDVRVETADTSTLHLEDLTADGVTFRPGQFMMLYVFGVGEVPISIAGSPRVVDRLEHTIRAVGTVTNALCVLEPGDVVGVRGPYGTAWPLDEANGKDLLIIAGGIGLAPLRPAIVEGLHRENELNSLALLYGARTPDDLLYRDDILGWEGAPSIQVETTVDRATASWWGDVGLVTSLLPRVTFSPDNAVAFVCGPEVMMRAVARELSGVGISPESIWISMERNMKCGVGLCGHCQYGETFLCKKGPVGRYSDFAARLTVEEI